VTSPDQPASFAFEFGDGAPSHEIKVPAATEKSVVIKTADPSHSYTLHTFKLPPHQYYGLGPYYAGIMNGCCRAAMANVPSGTLFNLTSIVTFESTGPMTFRGGPGELPGHDLPEDVIKQAKGKPCHLSTCQSLPGCTHWTAHFVSLGKGQYETTACLYKGGYPSDFSPKEGTASYMLNLPGLARIAPSLLDVKDAVLVNSLEPVNEEASMGGEALLLPVSVATSRRKEIFRCELVSGPKEGGAAQPCDTDGSCLKVGYQDGDSPACTLEWNSVATKPELYAYQLRLVIEAKSGGIVTLIPVHGVVLRPYRPAPATSTSSSSGSSAEADRQTARNSAAEL